MSDVDGTPATFVHPAVGDRVRCRVLKSSFASAVLRVEEVEGRPSPVFYRGILRGSSLSEDIYVCDGVQTGSLIECVVTAYSEAGLVLSEM